MKKFMIPLFILMLFLVPGVMAWDWDNVKSYDEDTKTVTIIDAFGLGDDIAKIRLLTPLVNYVGAGEEILVAEYRITSYEQWEDVFGDFETYKGTIRGDPVYKNIKYKYKNYYTEETPDYEVRCKDGVYPNGSRDNSCSFVLVGTSEKTFFEWKAFNPNTILPEGTVDLGLFTEVEEGETVEWVPTLFGKRITEWAVWTNNLNTNLMNYFTMDETSGAVFFDSVNTSNNMTLADAHQTGIIGNSWPSDDTNGDSLHQWMPGNSSLNFWMNRTDATFNDGYVFVNYPPDINGGFAIYVTAARIDLYAVDDGGNHLITATPIDRYLWTMVTLTFNETLSWYINGALNVSYALSNRDQALTESVHLSEDTATNYASGGYKMDEIGIWHRTLTPSEITQLYNSGDGITYKPSGKMVYLIEPEDNAERINRVVNFVISGNDTTGLDNLTLFINDAFNDSADVTGLNNQTNFTKTMNYGTHTWYGQLCEANGSCANTSSRTLKIIPFTKINDTYNSTTHETKIETIRININHNSSAWDNVLGNLVYNGTSYLGTKEGSGDNISLYSTVNIPLIPEQSRNVSFYWNLQFVEGSTITYSNSSQANQTIEGLIWTRCNDTYSSPVVLNYTIYNETNDSLIEASMYATFRYSIDGNIFQNYTVDGITRNNFTFCTNTNDIYTVNSVINLQATGYNEKTYSFPNEYFDNDTTVQKKLYLLDRGSNIIIQVRDSGLNPLTGYFVEIERYWPGEDKYDTVISAETDEYGQFVANLIENDVKYRFTFKDSNGVVKKTTADMTIACRATICVLPFVIEDVGGDFDRFQNATDYDWTFTFNNVTNRFIFTWNDVSGVSATNRLFVERRLWNGTTTICDTSSTASSGSLTCDVGSQSASYTAQVYRTVGSIETRIALLTKKVGDIAITFGKEGLLWSFFFMMTLITIGYWKPTVGIVSYLAGIVLFSFIGIINLNPAVLVAQFVIGIAFLWAFRG